MKSMNCLNMVKNYRYNFKVGTNSSCSDFAIEIFGAAG